MKLEHRLKKTTDQVFDNLTEPQKFVAAHPVITKMEVIGKDKYLVSETLRLGFVPCAFKYVATVIGDYERKKVVMYATVMKINRIEMVFNLEEQGTGCVVREEISVRSPLPIKSLMEKIFEKHHTQLFKNIDNAK